MEEVLNNVLNYITLYSPIIIAIIGSIATIVTSIKRVKGVQNDVTLETKRLQKEMVKTQELCNQVMKENAELKASLKQQLLDEHKIYTKEHKRG